jgi:RNA polymerase sigma-70 factor (ECF subfamily)
MPIPMDQHVQTFDARRELSSERSELELLTRVAEGDRAAFQQLYTQYYHPLLNFIRRLTGRLDLAEEGVNDVMLVVWTNGGAFAGRSKVSTWIWGIAYRKALKLLERSRRWSGRFKVADFDDCIEQVDIPLERDNGVELRDLIEHALRRLSPQHRAVVELTYFADRSYEEIAAITACPLNTVKTRMFHARAKLRKLLPSLGESGPLAYTILQGEVT